MRLAVLSGKPCRDYGKIQTAPKLNGGGVFHDDWQRARTNNNNGLPANRHSIRRVRLLGCVARILCDHSCQVDNLTSVDIILINL